MHKKSFFSILIVALSSVLWPTSSYAVVKAVGKFRLVQDERLTVPGTYTGYGDTQAAALLNARRDCAAHQNLDHMAAQCWTSSPDVSYATMAGGSYLKSCGNCRPEGNLLVCDWCKPVIERRQLDMNQCPGDAFNHVENCHGDLTCGACY